MALDVNNVVNVTVNISPKAATTRGFGQFLIIGTSNVIPKEERIRYYSSLQEVGADFGTDTDEYKASATYFSQSPTPSQLAIGYWDNKQLGTKSIIQGGIIDDIKSLFVDGAMKFTFDSEDYDLNINCSTCSTMEQVVSLLSESFIKKGTGTPEIPGTPEVQEVFNSILAEDPIDWDAPFSAMGTVNTIKLVLKDGTEISNKVCTTQFKAVASATKTTLATAFNSGFTTAQVTFSVETIEDKDYIKCKNNAKVSDPQKNIVKIQMTEGDYNEKLGFSAGFTVTEYVPYKAEVPTVPAVPAVYFADAIYKNGAIQIVPKDLGKTITAPITSVEHSGKADFSQLMKLAISAGGSVKTIQIKQESAEEVINILANKSQSWYACMFAETLQDQEVIDTSVLIEALTPVRIIGHTLQSPDEPTANVSLGSKLKDLGLRRTMCQYDPNNKFAIASYVGRIVTTNFLANNSTITMKFKQEPTVSALDLSTSEATYLRQKNINVFVKYSNDTAIIQEGTQINGSWSDEVIGLDWLQNYVQTALYNLLYTNNTKIPQTNTGISMYIGAINNALNQALSNGLITSGIWNGPEIGSLKTGSNMQSGYYVFAPDISTQSQADREARKAPVIQCAILLSGAFHDANVIINVQR